MNFSTAANTYPINGEFLLISHGVEGQPILAGRGPGEIAELIKSSGWTQGQTIRIDACWAGSNGVAQQVANILQTNVIASPVRTLDFLGLSLPAHSVAVTSTRAIGIPMFWNMYKPATPGKPD